MLLWDRGFYSVEVIRYLQRARRAFLMPVVCHGRKADHPLGPSGSNVFKLMKKSGWFKHTLQDGKKNKATVSICVKRGAVEGPAWQEENRHVGVCLLGDNAEARGLGEGHVSEAVRDRDQLSADDQCRIRTTTKKFNVRFLYVAIALLLRNLWVWLHHFVLSSPRRGRRRYNWEVLRVERMLLWLEHVAETMYGLVDKITTERCMPSTVVT